MALVAGHAGSTGPLVFNKNADPRAYLATAAKVVRDSREATALMRAGHDFHNVALVEDVKGGTDFPLVPPEARDGQVATITAFAPERIAIAVNSRVPALLVLAEPWYPGWGAAVQSSK